MKRRDYALVLQNHGAGREWSPPAPRIVQSRSAMWRTCRRVYYFFDFRALRVFLAAFLAVFRFFAARFLVAT